ncbi:hypothetical protein EJB05_21611 [Eragrostis curvula]|uniref:Uncharacterized protein n=1 Tax=Eragrostis curvula TaxID=38414 RepID=A0A5J9V3R8_9POAL|nr:hypothetical protein EJB05_21611 [Eragrostis curvula]
MILSSASDVALFSSDVGMKRWHDETWLDLQAPFLFSFLVVVGGSLEDQLFINLKSSDFNFYDSGAQDDAQGDRGGPKKYIFVELSKYEGNKLSLEYRISSVDQ